MVGEMVAMELEVLYIKTILHDSNALKANYQGSEL